MKTSLFLPASTRGNSNIGWLNGFHSFNFGSFYEPTRTAFGPLIILNDDIVQPGTGFGSHPHSNMEIISIPLSGSVTHKDSTGNEITISSGDVQMMSAGTGITHSEFNKGPDEVNFLQIWIQPDKKGVAPRHQQLHYGDGLKNTFQQIVSPDGNDESLQIQQSAWIHLGKFDSGMKPAYRLQKERNGIYIFLIDGEVLIHENVLHSRDAIAITTGEELTVNCIKPSYLLIIEVPLT
jgi:redox-sensitive bicupin YhaK (pirin superfamily)